MGRGEDTVIEMTNEECQTAFKCLLGKKCISNYVYDTDLLIFRNYYILQKIQIVGRFWISFKTILQKVFRF